MRHQIAIDSVVDERYRVISHLGTGGMAEVYCATDLQLGRKVALKVLHERFAADDEFVERFKREASSAAGLQHQHVVSIYDRGEWDGASYIAMEYVAGRTLKQLVHEDGPLDPARAADLTVQILRAARFAHRRGVIHRDFKPQNVIVDDDGRAKVTDFGIARAGPSDMTETGSIMGTAQYLSPEQAQGHAVNARSDLYSIGIVLYELLTGRVPFDAESAVTIALKQVSEQPVRPSERNPAVTPELEAVVLRALAKDPAARFADADEFIAALEAAASRIPSAAAIAAAEAAAAALPSASGITGAIMPPPPSGPLTGVYPGLEAYEAQRVAAPPPRPGRKRSRWPWLLVAALIAAGALLLLVTTLKPKRVSVPNVVGSTISFAQQRLRSDGFEVESVRDNSDKPRNTVIRQDPAAGATADEGSRITLNISDGPAITEVPDVIDLDRDDAHKKLRAAGFAFKDIPTSSDSVGIDHVIQQEPSARSQAKQGVAINLEISTGPERVAVPEVVGKSENDARGALEGAGFRVSVKQKEDAKADPGTVLAQSPEQGTQLARSSTVTITVAAQPKQVTVPDVVGRSQNNATKTLSGRGFEVSPEDIAVTTPDQDGLVQKQSVGPGKKVDRGSTVTITVGRFDATVTTPPTTTTPPPPPTTTTTPPPPPPPIP
ncbi:MAG: eukaryotic-like serine/threonine-protein kinase [Solirubrobacteraceae bacterium]|jgi:serine/threonine-protein kinase|nr:eukaryotic-like serine/threonine-protein kinase [Solirubrobacteraceae bacterium]